MGLAFLIQTDNVQLMSERKVFKEAEYAALLEAADVLAASRDEAARISAQATQGAAQALEQGRAEGLRQAQAEFAQRLAADALATQRQLQAIRVSMAHIVVRALAQFMDEVDPARLLASALRRVDSLLRLEPFVTLRVAPEQEASVRRVLAALGQQANWALEAAVTVDPSLEEGACVISTASGTLEIGTEAQLAAFQRAVEAAGASA